MTIEEDSIYLLYSPPAVIQQGMVLNEDQAIAAISNHSSQHSD